MAPERLNLLKSHPQKIFQKIAPEEKFGGNFCLSGLGMQVIRCWAKWLRAGFGRRCASLERPRSLQAQRRTVSKRPLFSDLNSASMIRMLTMASSSRLGD